MRRGSLASALTSIENLHKFVPGLNRAFSHHSSRDPSSASDNEESWTDGITSDLPHHEFAKNENWKSVQYAILSIFQQKPLTVLERTMLCRNMSELRKSSVGPFMYEYYQRHLVVRGMKLLLDKINSENSGDITAALISVWNAVYTEMLPLLQTVFHSNSRKNMASQIKDVTLLAFRDHVLLQLDSSHVTGNSESEEYPPEIVQMLLVLQHVPDAEVYNQNQRDLELMVAKTVNPYLGRFGFYTGDSNPVIEPVQNHVILRKKRPTTNAHPKSFQESSQRLKVEEPHSLSSLKVPAIERLRHEDGELRTHSALSVSSSKLDEDVSKARRKDRRHSVQFDLRS